MANKESLSKARTGTTLNGKSKRQEKDVQIASRKVREEIEAEFSEMTANFVYKTQMKNVQIVRELKKEFPDEEFSCEFETTSVRPDGGLFGITHSQSGRFMPVLISEAKNQGTNDRRISEGKKLQSLGNAIERLGKNVSAFRTLLLPENIIPFVCFGYGCDFTEGSSIRDRVVSIAQYGKLNTTYLHKSLGGQLARGSYYFREEPWSIDEMVDIMRPIARGAMTYYLEKYSSEKL